jgi:hypothetical protein
MTRLEPHEIALCYAMSESMKLYEVVAPLSEAVALLEPDNTGSVPAVKLAMRNLRRFVRDRVVAVGTDAELMVPRNNTAAEASAMMSAALSNRAYPVD